MLALWSFEDVKDRGRFWPGLGVNCLRARPVIGLELKGGAVDKRTLPGEPGIVTVIMRTLRAKAPAPGLLFAAEMMVCRDGGYLVAGS